MWSSTLGRRGNLIRRRMIDETEDEGEIFVKNEETLHRLDRLSLIPTRPLALLNSEQCADLEAIRQLAASVYNTPAYDALHAEIVKRFGTSTSVAPHTIGSYFMGCVLPEATSQGRGCTLLCAGSLPPPPGSSSPEGQKWGFCSQNVIWCLPNSSLRARQIADAAETGTTAAVNSSTVPGAFEFIYLTQIGTSSKALLFVDYPSYDAFPGFSKLEKARLAQRMYIKTVKLMSYEHTDLIGRVVEVDKLKERIEDAVPQVGSSSRTSLPPPNVDKDRLLRHLGPMPWAQVAFLALVLGFVVVLIIGVPYALRRGVVKLRPLSKERSGGGKKNV